MAELRNCVELTEDVALGILSRCGVAIPRQRRVRTATDAVLAAAELGGPVVVKAVADGLLHKSDLGLVITNVTGAEAVRAAAHEVLTKASAVGLAVELLVVEQVSGALDVVVGYKRDPQFGPTTIVGLGGVWTEMLDTVSVHVGAMDLPAALTFLERSQVGHMMRHARGGALDVDSVARTLVAVTDLGLAHPEIVAIDVNPVIVARDRAVAVDAVIERDQTTNPTPVTQATVNLLNRHDTTITQGATP